MVTGRYLYDGTRATRTGVVDYDRFFTIFILLHIEYDFFGSGCIKIEKVIGAPIRDIIYLYICILLHCYY